MFQPFESNGVTYYLTKVDISPISIRMEAFRMPGDRQKVYPAILLEEIHFNNGISIIVNEESSSGMKDGMFVDSFIDTTVLENAIDTKQIDSITICGKKIKLW